VLWKPLFERKLNDWSDKSVDLLENLYQRECKHCKKDVEKKKEDENGQA
jgi:hypothetical protein